MPRGMVAWHGIRWVFLLLLAGAWRCAPPTQEVTLLAFGDFHGALGAPRRDVSTGRLRGGAEALAAAIAAQRRARPERTFLLEAGDAWQGTPESNLSFGRSTVGYLNRLGVDAAALGNHEFDWGIDTLRARLEESDFPRLAANVVDARGMVPEWCLPWCLVERGGLRLGIIGFITPETPQVTLPQNVAALRFPPPEARVDSLVAVVREAGADLVVLLCHLGGKQDSTGVISGPLADLASQVRGVDAIVGGHTHTRAAGQVHGIPLVITGSKGSDLGRIVLRWNGTRVVSTEARCLPVFADSLPAPVAPSIRTFLDSVREATRPQVARVLARATRRLGEEELAGLIAESMRRAVGADVSVTNIGGVRCDFEIGDVTVGDVYELVPFENSLVTARLTGEQLEHFLASNPESVRLRGISPAPSSWPEGIDLRRSYKVVTNNFLAFGGDGFQGFLEGTELTWTDLQVRDVVQNALARSADGDGFAEEWGLEPAGIWRRGALR